ncbi:MAG: phosphopentomutase [Candidatus Baltobacteraceae bacterium]
MTGALSYRRGRREGVLFSEPKRGQYVMKRVVAIVIDSGGVGALPDAAEYGDAAGANTIGNVARSIGTLNLPNFERLGLGLLTQIAGVPPSSAPQARVARLRERSRGKDTITGHWEMMGVLTSVPFPTYPGGFPAEVVEAFTAIAGKPPLGNRAASGTEIIEELGAEHMKTGRPILYTSADPVFQIAAHEGVVPLETLYEWSRRAREMLRPPHNVNRVIARPFEGEPGAFRRTPNRRDYAIEPPPNLLDKLRMGRIEVHAVGKISDIYCGRGISSSRRAADNRDAMEKTFELLETVDGGFVFTNLNDFDSKYGHRRDVRGYATALEELDGMLPALFARLRPGDEVIFTADHGCDPTAPGSDHTREYVPFVHFGDASPGAVGEIEGLDIVGQTVERAFLS